MNQDEWHSGLEQQRKRETERQRQQRAESAEHVVTPGKPNLEFVPCWACRRAEKDRQKIIGSCEVEPVGQAFCESCRHNRAVIEALNERLTKPITEGLHHVRRIRAQAFREAAEWHNEKAVEHTKTAQNTDLRGREIRNDAMAASHEDSAFHFTALAGKESGE